MRPPLALDDSSTPMLVMGRPPGLHDLRCADGLAVLARRSDAGIAEVERHPARSSTSQCAEGVGGGRHSRTDDWRRFKGLRAGREPEKRASGKAKIPPSAAASQ